MQFLLIYTLHGSYHNFTATVCLKMNDVEIKSLFQLHVPGDILVLPHFTLILLKQACH